MGEKSLDGGHFKKGACPCGRETKSGKGKKVGRGEKKNLFLTSKKKKNANRVKKKKTDDYHVLREVVAPRGNIGTGGTKFIHRKREGIIFRGGNSLVLEGTRKKGIAPACARKGKKRKKKKKGGILSLFSEEKRSQSERVGIAKGEGTNQQSVAREGNRIASSPLLNKSLCLYGERGFDQSGKRGEISLAAPLRGKRVVLSIGIWKGCSSKRESREARSGQNRGGKKANVGEKETKRWAFKEEKKRLPASS